MTLLHGARKLTAASFVVVFATGVYLAAFRPPWSLWLLSVGRGVVWRLAGSERTAVLYEMHKRPSDPWPRGAGHVTLGAFESAEKYKGYLEPGGSFSPSLGSFGVSFWIVGSQGQLIATSDSVPLASTRQTYSMASDGTPSIVVETPYYHATWTVETVGRIRLHLIGHVADDQRLEIAIRGVGPAGGPLRDVQVTGSRLILNQRWSVELPASVRLSYLGREGASDWKRPGSNGNSIHAADGWAHARFAVPHNRELSLAFVDLTLAHTVALQTARLPRGEPLTLEGIPSTAPALAFEASLRAQVTTLLLGLVNGDTRPGDPVNYPLAWQRDGAYVIVALARAGHGDLAKRLAMKFAVTDFFGGYGAEADAPGLSIWALCEVSTIVGDPQFDRSVWPHIARKADFILGMAATSSEIRQKFTGPIVPGMPASADVTLVAGPNRNGLIDGRMDWERPVFYVNAVSYAGLARAALFARRLGHEHEADVWMAGAGKLKSAWRTLFATEARDSPDRLDEHTPIIGLWPTEVADAGPYTALLESRWEQSWNPLTNQFRARPLWTYFTLAEAHQWLRLGRPERCWEVLSWFWQNQPAPGLYTLWEGKSEENSFGLWQSARGWVRPPYVTPHYWSAAEMLLLQLEMLAYVDSQAAAPVLVVGQGVPAAWLSGPLSIRGVGTSAGVVDWQWADGTVLVTLHGPKLPVRLAPIFPAATSLRVISD